MENDLVYRVESFLSRYRNLSTPEHNMNVTQLREIVTKYTERVNRFGEEQAQYRAMSSHEQAVRYTDWLIENGYNRIFDMITLKKTFHWKFSYEESFFPKHLFRDEPLDTARVEHEITCRLEAFGFKVNELKFVYTPGKKENLEITFNVE